MYLWIVKTEIITYFFASSSIFVKHAIAESLSFKISHFISLFNAISL